jgi:hypothetical protein
MTARVKTLVVERVEVPDVSPLTRMLSVVNSIAAKLSKLIGTNFISHDQVLESENGVGITFASSKFNPTTALIGIVRDLSPTSLGFINEF